MAALSQISSWLRERPPRRLTVASVALVLLVYVVAGWSGMTRLGDSGGYDSGGIQGLRGDVPADRAAADTQ